jgi:hypothetical protein
MLAVSNKGQATRKPRAGQDAPDDRKPTTCLPGVEEHKFYNLEDFCDLLRVPEKVRWILLRSLTNSKGKEFVDHSQRQHYLFGRDGIRHLNLITDDVKKMNRRESQKKSTKSTPTRKGKPRGSQPGMDLPGSEGD